jgi:hypothetical protein
LYLYLLLARFPLSPLSFNHATYYAIPQSAVTSISEQVTDSSLCSVTRQCAQCCHLLKDYELRSTFLNAGKRNGF